jgi:hypothetical protein
LSQLRLIDPLGERPLEPADLPITLGGAGSDVVLPEREAGRVILRIGLEDGRLFAEPQAGAAPLLDGHALEKPTWLQAGTVLNLGHDCLLRVETRDDATALVIDYPAVKNLTLPPLLEGESIESAFAQADRVPIDIIDYRPPSGRPTGRGAVSSRRLQDSSCWPCSGCCWPPWQ